jgi:hypothetical protein
LRAMHLENPSRAGIEIPPMLAMTAPCPGRF